MTRAVQRIAIVGGGAGGALAAVHLLRDQREHGPLEIDLIDRAGSFGAGVAYGTTDPHHLLNVPAARMGGIAGHPEHFHEWLVSRGEPVSGAAFLPRSLYATYIGELLVRSEREAPDARLHRRRGEVAAVAEPRGPAAKLALTLADGEQIEADRVILALGPLEGRDPVRIPPELKASGVYVSDPWGPGALDRARGSRSVLIVGTGLSMIDVALTLGESEKGPRVRAVSRQGMVPRRHRQSLTNLRRFHIPSEAGAIEPILGAIFAQISRVSRQGDDWRDVIDSMRPATPQLWRSLRIGEKERFLADYQRLWDVHRFRMAPEVADRFEALQASGRVTTRAAAIVSIEERRGRVRVYLRTPGAHAVDLVEVDSVVNCGGAGWDLRQQTPPILEGLLDSGRARPDELGLGLDVDEGGALLDAEGRPSQRLFAVGSLRKGVEWEAIGITEIREQCGLVAQRILTSGRPAPVRTASPAPIIHTGSEIAA